MADRPIIFSAPMVRALLDGRKTQTRRLLNPQPVVFPVDADGTLCEVGLLHVEGDPLPRITTGRVLTDQCIHMMCGDRLYVREACWIASPGWTDSPINPMGPHRQEVAYVADDRSGYTAGAAKDYKIRQRPSIHMPRWASRLTLTVTEVRVQRLQDISEADAIAEGLEWVAPGKWAVDRTLPIIGDDPRVVYSELWNSLHTKPGTSWEDNPWILAISFTVAQGNIDQIGGAA